MRYKTVSPVTIFYAYSHEDKTLRDELEKHLSSLRRQGIIKEWHDREILAGMDWKQAIDQHLMASSFILLLISPDFLASDYCYGNEMQQAFAQYHAGKAHIVPILLRPVDVSGSPFQALQILPSGAKPVTSWSNRDEAFRDIALHIRRAVQTASTPPQTHASSPLQTQPSLPQGRKGFISKMILIGSALLLLAITAALLSNLLLARVPSPHASPTRTPNIAYQPEVSPTTSQGTVTPSTSSPRNPYASSMQQLILSDSLHNNSVDGQWDENTNPATNAGVLNGSCKFDQGSYQLKTDPLGDLGVACYAEAPQLVLTDFTYEAAIKFQEGSAAGLIFCSNASYPAKEYRFLIQTDGTYSFAVVNGSQTITLQNGKRNIVSTKQVNILAVVIDQGNISFYVNHQLLTQVHDTTYTQGRIGLYVPTTNTERAIIAASANNVTVWSRT